MSENSSNTLLEYVLWYYDQGFCIIPAHPREKVPAIEWRQYQKKRPSRGQIEQWFKDKSLSDINIGVICGEISANLVIFDFDDLDYYEKIGASYETFSLMTQTGSGKMHLWLRSEMLPRSFKIPEIGLEVRSNGNFTIVPPSLHPSGGQYTFLDETKPILQVTDAEDEAWKIAERFRIPRKLASRVDKTIHIINKMNKLRPCFRKFVDQGGDMNHELRLGLVDEAHACGFSRDEIINLFGKMDDFEYNKTSDCVDYKLKDIMGSGLKPWRCVTIDQHGGCIGNDCGRYQDNVVNKIGVADPRNFFEKDHNGRIKTFVPQLLGDFILEEHRFIATSEKSPIWIYEEGKGIWEPQGIEFIQEVVTQHLHHLFKARYAEEVVKYIRYKNYSDSKIFGNQKKKIVLLNGAFNLDTEQLEPFDPELYEVNQIPILYDPTAVCPKIEEFLSEILDPEDFDMIIESFGYCLLKSYPIARIIVLEGSGRNGKSQLLALLARFVGEDNISSLTLQELSYDRFAAAELYGKLVNTAADIPATPIKYTGLIKALTGGDRLSVQFKFHDRFEFVNYAKLFFSANEVPKTDDNTDAFFRRPVLIHFPNVFPADDPKTIPNIIEKITTESELSGLFNLAVEGLKRLLANGQFTNEKSVKEREEEWVRASNPAQYFVTHFVTMSENPEDYIVKGELYKYYARWCKSQNRRPLASNKFSMDIKMYLPNIDEGYIEVPNETRSKRKARVWYGIILDYDAIGTLDTVKRSPIPIYENPLPNVH